MRRDETPRLQSLERSRMLVAEQDQHAKQRRTIVQGKGHRPAHLIGVPTSQEDKIRERSAGNAPDWSAAAAPYVPSRAFRSWCAVPLRAPLLQPAVFTPLPSAGSAQHIGALDPQP